MATDEEPDPDRTRDVKRARQSAFVPLVLLLVILVIVAFLNGNLVEPYTGPKAVADEGAAYVFYENAEKDGRLGDRSFFLRKSTDGKRFEKAQRVDGTLVSVALLSAEHLVCLFPDFLSIYSRPRQLDREWSLALPTETLGFEPRHLARLGDRVFAFGTARDGALRAARLVSERPAEPKPGEPRDAKRTWRLASVDGARIEKAANPGPADTPDPAAGEEGIASPLAWASAEDQDGSLAILYRVPRFRPDSKARGLLASPAADARGSVRLARFDGTAFVGSARAGGSIAVAAPLEGDDLVTFAATAVPTSAVSTGGVATVSTRVLVYGVRHEDPEPIIVGYTLQGSRLVETERVPYKRGGFLREDRSAQALAVVAQHGRLFLFAQIGGAVRFCVKEKGVWGEWQDVARMPSEAQALVYLFVTFAVLLCAVMVVAAVTTLKRRIRGSRGPSEISPELADRWIAEATAPRAEVRAAQPEVRHAQPVIPALLPIREAPEADDHTERDASIPDRLVAFGVDLAIVAGVLIVIRSLLSLEATAHPSDDPTHGLAVLAWSTLALMTYLTLFEVTTGRTPGKRLLGLEIRALDGSEPTRLELLYRNLFRIELIFFATLIQIPTFGEQRLVIWVPLLALLTMIATPRTQRPGDLIARTIVQRVLPRETRTAGAPGRGEDEESLS